jgi:hypothetical protein
MTSLLGRLGYQPANAYVAQTSAEQLHPFFIGLTFPYSEKDSAITAGYELQDYLFAECGGTATDGLTS